MVIKPRNRSLDRWNQLKKRYEERGLVLALGAGVSIGCKLPSWEELLLRVGKECLGEGGRRAVQELLASGTTLPAIAGVLDSKCPKGVRFLDLLADALYRNFPIRNTIKTAAQEHKLVRFVQMNNRTMQAVAAFCARTSSGGEFVANERVHAVVTFNVDSVLRAYAHCRYRSYLFGTIESPTQIRRVGRIPIYQMHGFLRFDQKQRRAGDEPVRCVFTEGEYFDFFNRPHSVFNYTFLYLLREFNCLFIGMSMHDENIRRLLHYSTSERRDRFAAKGDEDSRRRALRHFAILKRSNSIMLDDLTDTSLKTLGTRVLWIDDFDEIPDRLAFVYSQTDWPKVY